MTFCSKSVGQSEVWWQRDKVRSHPRREDIGGWREASLLMKTGTLRREAYFHFIFEPIVEYQCERILTGNGKVGMWNFRTDDQIWEIPIQISHWKVKLLPKMSVKIKYLRTRILKEPDVRTQKEGKTLRNEVMIREKWDVLHGWKRDGLNLKPMLFPPQLSEQKCSPATEALLLLELQSLLEVKKTSGSSEQESDSGYRWRVGAGLSLRLRRKQTLPSRGESLAAKRC